MFACGLPTILILCNFVPAAQSDASARPTELKVAIQELFKTGIGPRRSREDAKAAYERAQRLAPGDPRLDYAWGLVQLRWLERDEGHTALMRAATPDSVVFLPATKASIWDKLARRASFTDGLSQLQDFARQVARMEQGPEATEAALWLGELFGVLHATARKSDLAKISDAQGAIQRTMNRDDLTRGWRKGQAVLRSRLKAREDAERKRLQARVDKAEKDAEATLARISKRLDDIGLSKLDAETSMRRLRETAEEMIRDIDSELRDVDARYRDRVSDVRSYTNDYYSELRDFARDVEDARRCGNLAEFYRSRSTLAKQRNLASRESRVLMASSERDKVLRYAQRLMNLRANVARQYQQRTGQIIKAEQTANRLAVGLAQKKKDLALGAPKLMKQRKPSFRTLFPFRIEDECDRLLKLF